MQRRLLRSRKDVMLGGVCGGLGEYLNVDPTVIRLLFVLMALAVGHGILIYLILWVVIPLDDGVIDARASDTKAPSEPEQTKTD